MPTEQQKREVQRVAVHAAAAALCARLPGFWYTFENDHGYKVTGGLNAERESPVVFYVRANPKVPRYAIHLQGDPEDDFLEAQTVDDLLTFMSRIYDRPIGKADHVTVIFFSRVEEE